MRAVTVALAALATSVACALQKQVPGDPYTVGYSARGLEIDGQPRMLTAGAIHYPRSAPAMWDSLMRKAKEGGLNTVDTYVFWNLHEPVKGHYDFATDRANLPLFLETARRNGLFVMLRIGPYVCAEWNYGGFPQWLRHEPDIVFRTYSKPFMREMKRFIGKVLDVVRPFMPEHGGPIVALQIENEYGNVQPVFGHDGDRYAEWCGLTARSFNTSVPWVMCAQYTHLVDTIPTDNGFYCDQNLARFRSKYPQYPAMWTELWPAWFQRWGEPAPHRPLEDIAYAVAKWFANGGTYVAYYMYHGGTNFGRTSGPFIQTSYDYDGFLDEYGLENWPKYLHLRDLHNVLLDNEGLLTRNAVPAAAKLSANPDATAHVYGAPGEEYLAFLVNSDASRDAKVEFDGRQLDLPRWSVTIVRRSRGAAPAVLYNTAQLSSLVQEAQKRPAGFAQIDRSVSADTIRWRPLSHTSPRTMPVDSARPLEHISVTDDRSDYLWYHTRIEVPAACARNGADHRLVLHDAGDVAFAYFNGHFAGMQHGQQDRLATFTFDAPEAVLAQNQSVTIAILSQTMGMMHVEPGQEAYSRGLLGRVVLCGQDITEGRWTMQPGLEDTQLPGDPPVGPDNAAASAGWNKYNPRTDEQQSGQMRWYALELDSEALAASGDDDQRLGVDLASMTKGQLWLNGHHLGRYWLRRAPSKASHRPCQRCGYGGGFSPDRVCRQHCGEFSQRYYHLPHSYLDPSGRNVLYVLEELGGRPEGISVAYRVSAPPVERAGVLRLLFCAVVAICAAAAIVGVGAAALAAIRKWQARRDYTPLADDDAAAAADD
ncbi:hypothetical protein H4R19_003495 [Coemansia spiralis]|nr:hypothetical protein H4R19_003495 [Coemansia spiralis]